MFGAQTARLRAKATKAEAAQNLAQRADRLLADLDRAVPGRDRSALKLGCAATGLSWDRLPWDWLRQVNVSGLAAPETAQRRGRATPEPRSVRTGPCLKPSSARTFVSDGVAVHAGRAAPRRRVGLMRDRSVRGTGCIESGSCQVPASGLLCA